MLTPDSSNSSYEDDWTDLPAAGFWPKWFGGMFLPLTFFVYGITCLIRQRGYLPTNQGYGGPGLHLTGANAMALGIACLAVALFLHCHYFWGNIYHLSGLATLGKIAGALTFIIAFGYLIVRIGAFGP